MAVSRHLKKGREERSLLRYKTKQITNLLTDIFLFLPNLLKIILAEEKNNITYFICILKVDSLLILYTYFLISQIIIEKLYTKAMSKSFK